MRSRILGAQFASEDAELIRQVCRLRGEDISDFIRRAVRSELARLSYLSPEAKKALGVSLEVATDSKEEALELGVHS